MSREHVGLLRRVSSLMRPVVGRRDEPASQGPVEEPPADAAAALEPRLRHLEALVEGLQDAVDRQARRYDEELERLRESMQPEALARSLSDDARRRGL
jgi:hypothetical protein